MKSETRSFYEKSVRAAVLLIYDGLDDALDLAALARGAALSPLHFHRIFRGMVGETPLELHRRLRMERAAYQLVTIDAPVTRVAFDAGYETHESFTRAFSEHFGASPSAYRQRAAEARACRGAPPTHYLACVSGLHFEMGRRDRLDGWSHQGGIVMNVEIENMPELRVAAVRHVGAYNRISEAFARLGDLAGRAGLVQSGARMLAVYHDDPEATPVDQLRSDAAITVARDAKIPEGLTEIVIPAGSYAVTTHLGPYSTLGDTWSQLMGRWLPESGRRLREAPSFEIYRNMPGQVPPEQLRTDLYVPVE